MLWVYQWFWGAGALNSYLCEVRVKVQLVVPKSDDRARGEQIRRSHRAPFDKRVDMNVHPHPAPQDGPVSPAKAHSEAVECLL